MCSIESSTDMEVSLDMYDLPEIRAARDTWAEAIVRKYREITGGKSRGGGSCKIHQEGPFCSHSDNERADKRVAIL